MTFPVVAATNNSFQTSNNTTHTVSLPSGISAGDLLLIFASMDGSPSITNPSGFSLGSEQTNAGADVKSVIWYKVATGSEGATVSFTTGTGETSSHITYRITGYSSLFEYQPAVSSSTGHPDPPTLTHSGGAADYMWIVVGAWDRDRTVSAYPTDYTGNQVTKVVPGAAGCGLAVATRNLNGTNQDPGAFTISTADDWVAFTIAVAPSSVPISITVPTGSLTLSGKQPAAVVGIQHIADSVTDLGAVAGTSITVTKPAGTAAGDMLVCTLGHNGELATLSTPPSGWTEIGPYYAPGNAATIRVYWKKAGASEAANYTWTWTGNKFCGAVMSAFRGAEAGYDVLDTRSGTSVNMAVGGVTTTKNGDMLLGCGVIINGNSNPITSPSLDSRTANSSGTSHVGAAGATQPVTTMSWLQKDVAGTAGGGNFVSSISNAYATIALALKARTGPENKLVNPYFLGNATDGVAASWQATYSDADIQAATTVTLIGQNGIITQPNPEGNDGVDAGLVQRIVFNGPTLVDTTRTVRLEILAADRPSVGEGEYWGLTFASRYATLTNCKVRALLEWYDPAGSLLQTDQFEHPIVGTGVAWQSNNKRFGMFGKAPQYASKVHLAFEIYNINKDADAFCDVRFGSPQLSIMHTANLLDNESVETNVNGWRMWPYTTSTSGGTGTGGTTTSATITIDSPEPTGTDSRVLFAGVAWGDSTETITSVVLDPSGVNKPLTLVATKQGTGVTIAVYRLMETDIALVGDGSKTLTATLSGTPTVALGAWLFYRMEQNATDLIINQLSASGNGTTAAITQTETVKTTRYLEFAAIRGGVNPNTIAATVSGSGQTNRYEINNGTEVTSVLGDIRRTNAASISWTGAQEWAAIGFYIVGRAPATNANGYPGGGGSVSTQEFFGGTAVDSGMDVRLASGAAAPCLPDRTYMYGQAEYRTAASQNFGPHLMAHFFDAAGLMLDRTAFIDPAPTVGAWNTTAHTYPTTSDAVVSVELHREFAGITNATIRHDMSVIGEFVARPAVNTPSANLTLTAYAPSIPITVVVTVPAASLALTTFVPQVNHAINVPVRTLALTGFAPNIIIPVIITVPVATLTATGLAPSVQISISVEVPVASLALTGYAPDAGHSGSAEVPAASLTLAGYEPLISISGNQAVTVPVATLTLTGYAPVPDLGIDVPTAALTLTGYAPSIPITGIIEVPTTSLSLTGYAPQIRQSITIPTATLVITGYAPIPGAGVTITVPVRALATATFAPSIILPSINLIPTGTLILAGYAPVVTGSADFAVTVPVGILVLTTYAPGVTAPMPYILLYGSANRAVFSGSARRDVAFAGRARRDTEL